MGRIRAFPLTFYEEYLDHASDPIATPLVYLHPGWAPLPAPQP